MKPLSFHELFGTNSGVRKTPMATQSFEEWFTSLTSGLPSLSKDQVTLTRANFRKAMKQAYRAGQGDSP